MPASAPLTARPSAIRSPYAAGSTARPAAAAANARVDRAAVGDVDPQGPERRRHRHVAGEHVRRHVAEGDVPHRAARAAHARDDPPGRHVDRHVGVAVGRGRDEARLDRPRAERDRPVPAGRREAVLVPEQHAEPCAAVVGRDREAAVHVGVPARLVAQQAPHAVDLGARPRVLAPVAHRRAGDVRRARRHDPERLAGGVVVGRVHLEHGLRNLCARGAGAPPRDRRGCAPAPASASLSRAPCRSCSTFDFFSSPFGGNSAWRPREPQTQPEKKPQDEADKERTTWTLTEY